MLITFSHQETPEPETPASNRAILAQMERRVAVRGIFIHDGKILCVVLKPYGSSVISGVWCTIGGTVESGENILQALEREIIEETAIMPKIGNLLYVQQFQDDHKENLEFFFNILNALDYLKVDLSKTTHGMAEIEKIEFKDPSKIEILPKFLLEEGLSKVTEHTPVKIFSYM